MCISVHTCVANTKYKGQMNYSRKKLVYVMEQSVMSDKNSRNICCHGGNIWSLMLHITKKTISEIQYTKLTFLGILHSKICIPCNVNLQLHHALEPIHWAIMLLTAAKENMLHCITIILF